MRGSTCQNEISNFPPHPRFRVGPTNLYFFLIFFLICIFNETQVNLISGPLGNKEVKC